MVDRDDFSQQIKETIARRAGQICSNPDCNNPTSGPHTQPDKAVNVGIAAHICAASPGGKRYDPNMTSEERGGIENAIWLCQTCAKLIDSDEEAYTTELIREWKKEHERLVAESLKGSSQKIKEATEIAHKLDRKMDGIAVDIAAVRRGLSVEVEVQATPCQIYTLNAISPEMSRDIEIGKLFYQRYLEVSFSTLPPEFYAQIVSLRSVAKVASGVQIDYMLDRHVQWAFWVYKDYGTVRHNRSYVGNVFSLSLSPFYDTSWVKMYFMHSVPFQLRQIEIQDRYR